MAINTENINLKKPLLTEAADIEVLNDNFDLIDDEVGRINGRLKKNVIYFSESQSWTVPNNVTQIDVFIVDGGYDGANGISAPYSKETTGYGGDGGNGGACAFYPNINVVPGTVIPVVVGAANGGKSAFDGLSSVNIPESVGGDGSVVRTPTDSRPITNAKGNYAVINGLFTGIGCKCPIDGKYYGISGGAGCNNTMRLTTQISVAGGVAGKNNADKRPMYGEVVKTSVGSTGYLASGGGASYDNDGYPNESETVGGKGGDAVSYGCGGGGGGGAPYKGTGGAGGTGATGGVIIAY